MNFEDAFKHYKEGTATEEERQLVLDELAKAKALSSLMDDDALAVNPAPVAEADINEIKAAKKQFKAKNLIIALGSICAVLVVIGAILGGVFGYAASCAKKQIVYDKPQCIALAKTELIAFINNSPMPLLPINETNLRVDDVDADFHFEADLGDSYYSYKVELETPDGTDYVVNIDTRTGKRINDKGIHVKD